MSFNIKGKDLVLKLREDGTTGSYLDVVCETTTGFSSSAAVTTETTKCGTRSTIAEPISTISFEGIYEEIGPSYLTVSDLLNWHNASTLLNFEYTDPENDIYLAGDCYISELTISAPSEGFVSYTFTLQIDGLPETTP